MVDKIFLSSYFTYFLIRVPCACVGILFDLHSVLDYVERFEIIGVILFGGLFVWSLHFLSPSQVQVVTLKTKEHSAVT